MSARLLSRSTDVALPLRLFFFEERLAAAAWRSRAIIGLGFYDALKWGRRWAGDTFDGLCGSRQMPTFSFGVAPRFFAKV